MKLLIIMNIVHIISYDDSIQISIAYVFKLTKQILNRKRSHPERVLLFPISNFGDRSFSDNIPSVSQSTHIKVLSGPSN